MRPRSRADAGVDVVEVSTPPRLAKHPVRSTIAPRVTSPFGQRKDPITGALAGHNGIDFGVAIGTELVAADDGVVEFILPATSDSGNAVGMVRDDGVKWSYSHMSRVDVHVGQRLSAGDHIGLSGNTGRTTGPHLHFVVRANGGAVDPALMLPTGSAGAAVLLVIVGVGVVLWLVL